METYNTVTIWMMVVVNVVTVTGTKFVLVAVAAVAVTDTVKGVMARHWQADDTLAVKDLAFTAVRQASVEGEGFGALGLRLALAGRICTATPGARIVVVL